jgi:hypothetical protein
MRYLRLFLAVTFTLLACARAYAQSATGTIRGIVLDASGRAVSGAKVSVHPGTATTVTDARGSFEITALAIGRYEVVVVKPGFIESTLAGVRVGNEPAEVGILLQPETLSTLAQIASVQTSARGAFNTSASAMTTLSQQNFIDQGQIQIGHVLDQVPGVISARPGSADAAVPGSITSPNLRGALDYEKATLLDGHPLINGKNGDYPTMLVNSLLFDDVEVVKGPTAYAPEINYGIGGTLNFRTGDPTYQPSGSLLYGVDNTSGSFANLRLSDTILNGKLGYLVDLVTYGTQGPLNNYQSYVALPKGAILNGYGTIAKAPISGTPVNGATGPYPVTGAAGNPANAYTTMAACCQSVSSSYLNRGELAKLQYHISSATVATAAFIGIQSQYDGPASGFTQIGSTFAPGAGFDAAGSPIAPGNPFLLNNKLTLPDQTFFDNEPMFEGELRSTLGNDTVLARYYSAVLARQTTSDNISAPSANYTVPMTLYGSATLTGTPNPVVFNGTPVDVTIPTPYSNSVEHDDLHGVSFEYDHPVSNNLYTLAYDENTSLTDAYSVTGSATKPQGNLTTSIAPGTRQDFTTWLARGTFAFTDRLQLTLANYYNVYRSTYTPETVNGNFVFATTTTTHDDPRLGLSFRANPNLALRLSAGSSIAPPYPALIDNLTQNPANLYTPGATSITASQNSGTLKPETSFGYDLGGDARIAPSSILSVDLYLTNLWNQFVGVITPTNETYNGVPIYISTNENLAQSRYEGVEATFNHDPAHGYGYTLAGALQRAYAYNIPPGFYTSAAGPDTTNLGVVPGVNFYGFNSPFFNGISNKSEAYSQSYAALHYRGSAGQYTEFGMTYYGSNNTYDVPAFWIGNATYRQPLHDRTFNLQLSVDNIFNANPLKYVLYGAGIGAPLANDEFGIRSSIPYGPTTFRAIISHSFGSY